MSPTQAMDVTYNALFDYFHGLTSMERNVLRRAIPFYSFLRFNGAFQTKQVFIAPTRVVMPERMMRIGEAGGPSFRDLLFPFEESYTSLAVGDDSLLKVRLPSKEWWNMMPRDWNLLNVDTMGQWFEVLHPMLKATLRPLFGKEPNYGGPQRDYLYSDKFGVLFNNAPTMVKEFLGVKEAMDWSTGKATYSMDPWKLFLISSLGLGRMLSTVGKLDEAFDISSREVMYTEGMANSDKYWTAKELTRAQALVSAFLGMPYDPMGPKQIAERQYRKKMRTAVPLRRKVTELQKHGHYPPAKYLPKD